MVARPLSPGDVTNYGATRRRCHAIQKTRVIVDSQQNLPDAWRSGSVRNDPVGDYPVVERECEPGILCSVDQDGVNSAVLILILISRMMWGQTHLSPQFRSVPLKQFSTFTFI